MKLNRVRYELGFFINYFQWLSAYNRHIHKTQNLCKYEGFVVYCNKEKPRKEAKKPKSGV